MKGFFPRHMGKTVPGVLILLYAAVAGIGCSTDRQNRLKIEQAAEISTLLVVPFVDGNAIHGENEVYRCSLCGGMYETSRVEKGADSVITDTIVRIISENKSVTLVPNERIVSVRLELLKNRISTPTDLELMAEMGRELGADAVVTGSIYRWVERSGSNYAADAPASVGFDIDLIDTETSRLIWHHRVDESQQFLIDNLLKIGTFIKRGGKWITAEQMAAAGLEDVLERSPIP